MARRRDKSLSIRFLIWWAGCVTGVITLCAAAFFFAQKGALERRLQKDTMTLAAVTAPRLMHDMQSHMAGYAHRTLRSMQTQDKHLALSLYGPHGELLFSTHPVFRRLKEIPPEVSQVLKQKQPLWLGAPLEDRGHAFYPLFAKGEVEGVLQLTRNTEDLAREAAFQTLLLALLCAAIAALASALVFLFLRRHYFRPLRELNSMMVRLAQPAHAATALEIPESEFHGELASLYRNAAQLAQSLNAAKKSLETREDVRKAAEHFHEESQFLAHQIYETKMARPDHFPGYEIFSKPMAAQGWGRLWKNAFQDSRRVVFSYWKSKNEGLKAVLQGLQWDEILQRLAQEGKNLEDLSDEMFMEFGLDLDQWLIGQFDAYDRRLEIMGNAWACHWAQEREAFAFLKSAEPLAGSRKQGFWANWSFLPSDKLIVFHDKAFAGPAIGGMQGFVTLLSKNIKSSPQNLSDLLLQEMEERRLLAAEESYLLLIHQATPAAVKQNRMEQEISRR